ncbi:MAG: hypothetical protein RL468_1242, partial [Pseudomonadota bacterium]
AKNQPERSRGGMKQPFCDQPAWIGACRGHLGLGGMWRQVVVSAFIISP